jgi:MFS transporter, FHS family, glucose/mannose:H+ symporter
MLELWSSVEIYNDLKKFSLRSLRVFSLRSLREISFLFYRKARRVSAKFAKECYNKINYITKVKMYKRNLVFAAACMGMLLFGIVLISLGSLLPSLTSKFILDELAAGFLATLLPAGILVGSVIFGPVADRYGYKILLIVFTLFVFLGLEGIAFAESVFVLQLSIFFIGIGGGVLNGATNALVADISDEGKGANLSLLGVFFGIGALGMPAILGILYSYFSYEEIIKGIGLFVLLSVVFFVLISFPVPKQQHKYPVKESLSLLKNPVLILFGFILFFESGMEGLTSNWTTTFLISKLGAKEEDALYVLSYFMLGLTVTRLILGRLLKKISFWVVIYFSILIVAAGCIVMMFAGSYLTAALAIIILGIGFAAVFPVILGAVGEIFANLSGTAFSIALVIALIGNMLLNYSMGVIAHNFGINNLPVLLLFSLVIMTFLVRTVLRRIQSN